MKKVLVLIACVAMLFFASCKKNGVEPKDCLCSGGPPTVNYTLKAVATDPYTGNQIAGGAGYLLVKDAWESGMKLNFYSIYPNRATGKPQSNSAVIYYYPTVQSEDIQFGSAVNANIEDFRNSVNAAVKKDGYVIVQEFFDGGPSNKNFSIYQLPKIFEGGTW